MARKDTKETCPRTGKPGRVCSGFTLIELLISLSIVAMVMAVLVPSVNSVMAANLRVSASKLASSIRYTYDLAARKNATFRLVFDLEESAYWVETTADKFLLDRDKIKVSSGQAQEAPEPVRRSSRFVTRGFIESGDMWQPKPKPSFTGFASRLTEKVKLPNDIHIDGVWVDHQSDRVTTGMAFLYFFPTGMTQKATIHLRDEDDDFFSIEVEPLTGRIKLYAKYVDFKD